MTAAKNPSPLGASKEWDTSYEWKAVTLLGLGFGLVGLDRWIIAPLFPFMLGDLGLNLQDQGNIIGALGMAWGVFAVFSGRVSDADRTPQGAHPGRLPVLGALRSLGLATGFASLFAVRLLMGVMEGSYCPTSFTATAAASYPSRRGFLQGLQQCGFALFGLALGPIIATQLLQVVPSWRWVFLTASIPGLIVGSLLYLVLREPADTQGGRMVGAVVSHGAGAGAAGPRGKWSDVFKSRNIVLSMCALFCAMTCVFVLGAMVPNYLLDYLKLSPTQMGFVMSGLGFGGFVGQFAVPGLSDLFGRRVMAVAGFFGAAVFVYLLKNTGRQSGRALHAAVPGQLLLPGQHRVNHRTDLDRVGAGGTDLIRHRHGGWRGRDLRRRRGADHRRHRGAALRHPEHPVGGDVGRGPRRGRLGLPA
jgi:MFS family permease